MIRLDGVHKAWREARTGATVPALVGFDLAVAPGELVAVLGPSGSGKSTLLRLIAGFDQPDAGRVTVAGAPVGGIGPDRVLVAQDPALFGWLTVWQNVAFGPEAAGAPAPERVAALVEALGLSGAESRYPRELSGGMRQRVALARALAVQPRVLLLDEPFAALDALSRERLQDLLESVWLASRSTVVLVTHSVDEALRLADRVLVVTERPARLRASFSVDAPRPRDVAALAELRREVGAAVRGV